MYNLVLMAGTNGDPYPADSTDEPGPPGSGELFEPFDEYQRYEEPARDRGWSVVDVTPAYNQGGDGRGAAPGITPPPIPAAERRPVPGQNNSRGNTGLIAAIAVVALIAVLGALLLSWIAFSRSGDSNTTQIAANGVAGEQNETTNQIQQTMQSLGLGGVQVEQREDTIFLSGTVATEDERRIATSAASSLVGDLSLNTTQLAVAGAVDSTVSTDSTTPAGTVADSAPQDNPLQSELNRIIASRPIIFDTAQSSLTDKHQDILGSVAQSILKYDGTAVNIVGLADTDGSTESNREISLRRAENVRDALVALGVNRDQLTVEARGETGASGSKELGALERRVEFEAGPVPGASVAGGGSGETLRVGVVAPSARNDFAFTQSMVDALNVITAERGNVEVDITDNTFVPEDGVAAINNYASSGYDLIIVHSTQYQSVIEEVAKQYPDVAFAWGTSTETFGLSNLYAYSTASQEGGYVLGAVAGSISESGTVGVIGPLPVGDGAKYVNGFKLGAQTEANAEALVEFTDSFHEVDLARKAAENHIAAGADVLSGTSESFVGAVDAAETAGGVSWFGNQSNQSSVSPDIVVASQVYHWEVVLRPIVADIDQGNLNGRSLPLTLANNGLTVEFNPSYTGVSDEVRAKADEIANQIRSGQITVPTS